MTRKFLFTTLMLISILASASCSPRPTSPTPEAGMPNPASVYCEQNGGKLELRQDASGGVAGICVFPDGSECDEWAYFRAECKPGDSLVRPEPTLPPVIPTNTSEPPAVWQIYPSPEGLAGLEFKYLNSLAVAPDNTLWVGSDNDGVFHHDGNIWQQYTTAGGLADNSVHDFAFAPDGTLWIATWFGVSHFDGQNWQTYPVDLDFVGNDFHSLAVSLDGSVLLGSGRGMLRLQGEEWVSPVPGTEPSDLPAFAIWADPDGAVWFGAGYRTLDRIQGNQISPVETPDFPEGLRINDLRGGPDGALWMGTSHGVYLYSGEEWQTPADGLLKAVVTSLALAPDGMLWVGTYGQGVYRYDGQNWRNYTSADGLVEDTITAIAVTQEGTVWVASASGLGFLVR